MRVEVEGKIIEFPDGTPQSEIKAALDRQFGNTSNQVAHIENNDGFSVMEMMGNIPGSLYNQFSGLAQSLASPVDTAKGLGSLYAGVGQKLQDTGEKYLPDSLDFLAFSPIGSAMDYLGKDHRPTAEAVGEHYANRYGGVDEALETLESDPAGVLMDVSGLVSPVSPKLATAINPISGTIKAANKVRTAIPESLPRGLYERAAKFSTTLDKAKREKLVDTAVTHGLYPSQKGVDKLNTMADALSSTIDDLVLAADDAGKGIPVNAVFKHLKGLRQKKGGILMEAGDDLEAINQYAKQLKQNAGKAGKTHYSASDLQKIKRDLYEKIGWDAKRMKGSPIKEDTYKAIAKGAKEGVEALIPESQSINKDWGDLLELLPHLQRSANRIENRNLISLSAPMNIGAGTAAAGTSGMIAGVVASILENPKVSPRIAMTLEKMRKTGKIEKVLMDNPSISQAEFLAYIEREATEKSQ